MILEDWHSNYVGNPYRVDSKDNRNYIIIWSYSDIDSPSFRTYRIMCFGNLKILDIYLDKKIFSYQNEAEKYVDNILTKYDNLKAFI